MIILSLDRSLSRGTVEKPAEKGAMPFRWCSSSGTKFREDYRTMNIMIVCAAVVVVPTSPIVSVITNIIAMGVGLPI